ncbi:MAG TPA: toll/interleukin-1 receptor domain-containing protein [Tepidisphaeraceae bacterium]|jgi:hypothetical protein|nr:toll/interleukin-1 receptor domain-containing protein [Tepidisphaeraceae bacterium]
MATVWITYAWKDNEQSDVDFIAQELEQAGVKVKLDRWTIGAGNRLWDQIEKFIQDPHECDAWILYATANSLGSEPCREEYAYALDRALNARGDAFPVIGLFHGTVDKSLIPAGIRTRLYVALADTDWKERIVAAAEGRAVNIARTTFQPYVIRVHERTHAAAFVIEMRPRAGVWSPFIVGIPMTEKDEAKSFILRGPANTPPTGGVLHMHSTEQSKDGAWWLESAQDEATPTQSYFLLCAKLPSEVIFGVNGSAPQYRVKLR